MTGPTRSIAPSEFLPRPIRVLVGAAGRGVRDGRLREAMAHKVALITGASSGIGEATARRLGRAGATVVLVARRKELLERLRRDIEQDGGRAHVHSCDLTDFDAVEELVEEVLDEHGHVDVLVCNAGHSIRRWISDSYDRFHDFQRTIDINYLGPVRLTIALLPSMRARREGHIVNVSTAGVTTAAPGWTAYIASKTAFDTWFRGVAPEARADAVTASTIYMPLVRTAMVGSFRAFRYTPGMSADEAADIVCRAIVERPRSIAPWWWRPATTVQWALDEPIQRLLTRYAKRFNPASRASDRAGAAARSSVEGPRRHRLALAARSVWQTGVSPATLLSIQAGRFPTRLAVVDDRGSWTFQELDRCVRRLAAALRQRFGLAQHDRVGIMCRNHFGFVVATMAAFRLGAATTFVNTDFEGPQLAHVLGREGVGVAIYDEEFDAAFDQAGFEGERVIAWAEATQLPHPSIDELIDEGGPPVPPSRRRGEITMLTSGTTGAPRGAARRFGAVPSVGGVLTKRFSYLITSARRALRIVRGVTLPRSGQAVVNCLPMHHGFGLGGLFAGLVLGSPVVLRRRFDPEAALQAIERYEAGMLCVVPTMLKRIMDLPADHRQRYDTASLRLILCGAARLPAELCTAVMGEFGDVLVNGYGATELGAAAFATASDLRAAPGTVGYPVPTADIKILDERGCDLPAGRTGRIYIKKAFTPSSEAMQKVVVNGYVRSGDVGHFDEADRLFIDGRDDDMIVSGGENVYPQEVEELLQTHHAVDDAAAVGVPDDDFGQRLAAFVVLKQGGEVSADDLKGFVKTNLGRQKVPRDLVFVDRLPRTSTGKLQRKRLSQLHAQSDGSILAT